MGLVKEVSPDLQKDADECLKEVLALLEKGTEKHGRDFSLDVTMNAFALIVHVAGISEGEAIRNFKATLGKLEMNCKHDHEVRLS